MKVLVIGGAGAFGARLCVLLARDGADVTVAGRGRTGPVRAGQTDIQLDVGTDDAGRFPYMVFDRDGPLDGLNGFDVVVDAAGPFHAYGGDPYRIARAAIAAGVHYFDLSDNADFCTGIAELDAKAKAAGVCAYSGMSSVPAVSSSVVTALTEGAKILSIESAILPGNKAPRGRSVVESIVGQAGAIYTERRAGQEVPIRSWSGPETYRVGPFWRQAWRIEVPDQRLFPGHFNCGSVSFRAGLELGVMRYGLALFSLVRGWTGFRVRPWGVTAMMIGAKALAPFGTDLGGMVVKVRTGTPKNYSEKTWTMIARDGHGPFTPAIPVRAACRDLPGLPAAAGPALSVLSLDQIEACFEDLSIEVSIEERPLIPPFRNVLGDDLDELPSVVAIPHDHAGPRAYAGRARVRRGTGPVARIAALLFGFPPTIDDIEVEVQMLPDDIGETWIRRFGTRRFRSYLKPTPEGMTERFGAMTFLLGLEVAEEQLQFPVKSGSIWGIPIPRFLLPKVEASERQDNGRYQFDVKMRAPTGGLLVHYSGWLQSVEDDQIGVEGGAAGEN